MYKKHIIVFIALVVLSILPSFAYAAPEWNGGLVIWPKFWQMESPWNDKAYDHMDATIEDKGCGLTSLAMLLRNHGMHWIPDDKHNTTAEKITPLTLNTWMTDNGLFTQGTTNREKGNVKWWDVKKFYYRNIPFINWHNSLQPLHECWPYGLPKDTCFIMDWKDGEPLLDFDVQIGQPAIMKIDKGGGSIHFVLASGYDQETKSYRANDPGKSYNASLGPPLEKLYPKDKGVGRRGQIFYFDKWQIRADKGKVQNERFDPYLHDSYLQLSLKTKQNEGKNTENL